MENSANSLGRRLLAEFLGFLKFKIERGELSLEEEQALLDMLESSVCVYATVDELANYYGKSPEAVRAVASRKMFSKPRRRVLYNFNEFRRVAPPKWRK